ncbi:winged helix-turn-helix transcriptional regulator [Stagnihabitans tardus]|uniref:winged helix-turn-helix transcriptional regulator n=1 Tax=Stagnihabitans tardus TaxID=2699202 RepID=UPI00338E753A
MRRGSDAGCAEDCPVARAHGVLGGKWTTLIFRDLLPGPQRYSGLMRSLGGISPRMLAERLDMLEEAGLVERRVYPTNPPTTDYRLTALGQGMGPVIAAMAAFGSSLPPATGEA